MKIGGKQKYLWRAVDQDGDVGDVFVQNAETVKRPNASFVVYSSLMGICFGKSYH